MSRPLHTAGTLITRPFAGRDRRFQLRLGEIAELERIVGAGIGAITDRIVRGQFYAGDVWETIRLGLEGAGTPEIEASALLTRYHAQPIIPYVGLASDILTACLAGTPDDRPVCAKPDPRPTPPGDLSAFYGAAAAVGLSPAELRGMTVPEFVAVMEGFGRFHGGTEGDESAALRDDFMAALADEAEAGRI